MTVSIGEKKRVGGAVPRYSVVEEYRQCRGVTSGISTDSGEVVVKEADLTVTL